jgi:hypothetical protein
VGGGLCEWSTGATTCSGVIKTCSMLDETHCSLQPGCTWN